MDQKVILRFRNASKAGTSAEFPVRQYRSISIGRDPSCEVAFDPDRDDLVSRLHSKITIEAANPPSFVISDFSSRNGTFVNRQRITAGVKLAPGDVIQLGPGGPEIEFDLDPRPSMAKATRLASDLGTAPVPAMTREAVPVPVPMTGPSGPPPPMPPPPMPVAPPPHTVPIGKATVERMIAQNQKKTSSTVFLLIGGLLFLLLLIGGALAIPAVRQKLGITPKVEKLTPAEIAKACGESVVFFEMSWKLIDLESGKPVHHLHLPNRIQGQASASSAAGSQPGDQPQGQQGQSQEIVPGGPASLPVFIQTGNGLEPVLTTADDEGPTVGSAGSGSGFVVSSDGFILTNRHVASNWLSRYDFGSPVGVLLQVDQQGSLKAVPIGAQSFPAWVPAKAQFILSGKFDPRVQLFQQGGRRSVEGRNDILNVTFPRNRERIQAKLIRISDPADVALVKVDIPRAMKKLELYDNYNTIAQGEEISVLGYPAISPNVVGAIASKEALTPSVEYRVIPDPTLSVGNIGRILRGKAGLTEATMSQFGDTYQLTVNSTGAGNSGGPVLDDHGRVVGLFTYARQLQGDARITFAVPIRYGIELMGTKPVM